jgi:hypothetical protein
METKIRIKL